MTDHSSSLVSQRLLFGNGNNLTVSRDPVALANRLAQHYKLLDFGPRPGHERSFIHRSFTAVTGELAVTCGYASPIYGVMGERPDTGSVNLIRSGFVSYQCGGNHYSIAPQQPFYFSPSLEYSYASDHYNGVVFDVNIPRLLSTAAAMIGRPVLTRGIQAKFSRCQVLSHDDGRVSHLIRTLCNSLLMLDCPATFAKTDLPYLRIDDLVYRCLCLLLLPELYYELPSGEHPILATNRVFDELTEWIIDSLAHPISLTQLEQRSTPALTVPIPPSCCVKPGRSFKTPLAARFRRWCFWSLPARGSAVPSYMLLLEMAHGQVFAHVDHPARSAHGEPGP